MAKCGLFVALSLLQLSLHSAYPHTYWPGAGIFPFSGRVAQPPFLLPMNYQPMSSQWRQPLEQSQSIPMKSQWGQPLEQIQSIQYATKSSNCTHDGHTLCLPAKPPRMGHGGRPNVPAEIMPEKPERSQRESHTHFGSLIPQQMLQTAGASRPTAPMMSLFPGRPLPPAAAAAPAAPANPAAPAAPASPAKPGHTGTLDAGFRLEGFINSVLLQLLFGPSPSGRSRGYVHDLFGYMPFADGYGGGMIGNPPCPPWWWDWQERGPYLSEKSFTKTGTFMPERPWNTCPPDCEGPPDNLITHQPE